MAISINFTKTVDNAVDLSQKKTYINGAFTSASDIANFPTVGIATGSELVNVGGGNDTGKKYVFSGTAWNLAPSGGGGGLPSVTSADNGKVLEVENGVWVASDRIVQLFALFDPTTYAITADNEDDKNYSYYEIADMVYAGGYSFVLNIRVQGLSGTKMAFVHPETPLDNEIGFIGQMTDYNSTPVLSYDIRFTASDSEGELVFTGGFREKGKFIVTLTPTAQDYSGTMDKTVAEMTEAYNAGMQIVWRVIMASNQYVDVNVTAVMTITDSVYPSFNAYVIEIGTGVLVYAYVPATDDGTVQTYGTRLYALTPVS